LTRRVFSAALTVAVLASAVSARAQTPPVTSGQASAPSVNLWYIGGMTGLTVVQKSGAFVGGEAGFRVWQHLDLLVEGAWMQNVVTRRELGRAALLTTFLQQTQGQTATSTMKVPALYGAVGARWVLEREGRFRPYVEGMIGGARVQLKPTFALGGTDITAQLAQYGVTLGGDLTGTSSHAAFGAGVGVLMAQGDWYLDFGLRLTAVSLPDQKTKIGRLNVEFGRRF
jgi:hypothetical protein